jgi:gamma-glutamyltranspeptidase/glutathione hydrolase
VGVAALLALLSLLPAEARPSRTRGVVAADHPLASQAGAELLAAGGNAVDAAVAAALSSGVVQPAGSGLGGGGFAVVAGPGGVSSALDFREVAPAAAARDLFAGGASSREGGLAVAVPAEAFGLIELHARHGRLSLARVAAPAIAQANGGFETGAHLARALVEIPSMQTLFGPENRRTGLARALRALVSTRGRAFRDGWVARDMVDAVRAAGGVLTRADLVAYKVRERPVLRGTYGSRTVLTMPPPSSGGVALLTLLAVDADSPHCRVEAAKHAMAARAALGGDPDFLPPATQPYDASAALSAARIGAIRADCGPATFPAEHYASMAAPPDDHGTLHISVLDADGWAVALTTTINTSFGSRVVAPASGIVLNNQMDDFTARPGQPNAFGLIQGEANAVAPGKRPLSSMTPTIVLDAAGAPELAAGASGGPFIITATAQVVRAVLDDGVSPAEAVAAPRWHHQWLPDAVLLEPDHPDEAALRAAGHVIKPVTGFSAVQVAQRLPDGTFRAASDPRKGGAPAAVE